MLRLPVMEELDLPGGGGRILSIDLLFRVRAQVTRVVCPPLLSILATDEFCVLGKHIDLPESKEISSSVYREGFRSLELK